MHLYGIIAFLLIIFLLAGYFGGLLTTHTIDLEALLTGYTEGFYLLGQVFKNNPLTDLVRMIATGRVNGDQITLFNLDEVIKALATSLSTTITNGTVAVGRLTSVRSYFKPIYVNKTKYEFQKSEGW